MFNKLNLPPFVKNVFTLSFGTAISQVIGFLFLPILGRLYSPEDFGLFYTFTGVALVLGLFATLKYEKAIILPQEDKQGNAIVLLTSGILAFFSCLCFAGVFLLKFMEMNIGVLDDTLLLIPLTVFTFSFFSTINLWQQREEKFSVMSGMVVGQSIMTMGLSAIFGFLGYSTHGLIFGYFLGTFSVILALVIIYRDKFKELLTNYDYRKFTENLTEYIDFPKFYLPYILLSTGTVYIVPVIITYFYSQEDTGFYSMAFRILMVPQIIISFGILNVFLVDAKKKFQEEFSFQYLYKQVFLRVLGIGFIIYLVAYLIGSFVIVNFIGEEWLGIEPYVKILSVLLFFDFISVVFRSNTYVIVQKQKIGLFIQAFASILSLSSLIFLAEFGITTALIVFTSINVFFNIIHLIVTYQLSNDKRVTAIKPKI